MHRRRRALGVLRLRPVLGIGDLRQRALAIVLRIAARVVEQLAHRLHVARIVGVDLQVLAEAQPVLGGIGGLAAHALLVDVARHLAAGVVQVLERGLGIGAGDVVGQRIDPGDLVLGLAGALLLPVGLERGGVVVRRGRGGDAVDLGGERGIAAVDGGLVDRMADLVAQHDAGGVGRIVARRVHLRRGQHVHRQLDLARARAVRAGTRLGTGREAGQLLLPNRLFHPRAQLRRVVQHLPQRLAFLRMRLREGVDHALQAFVVVCHLRAPQASTKICSISTHACASCSPASLPTKAYTATAPRSKCQRPALP
ncbi:hypothetical protein NB713_001501 [Xanthomonas sacchari]|nr:hypothetical protein [Xanthomonas sacchari]